MVPIRPEAEQKLRAGFQRRVDRQAERYAAQLTHAGQLAVRLEYGEVAGVFSGQAGGDRRRGAYPSVGPLLRGVMPAAVGATMPRFPTIAEVIAAFAGKPGPRV